MFDTVTEALEAFKSGKPIVVVDDVDRENEGDIVFPASMATQEKINFCATHARGLVCIAMHPTVAKKIGIEPVKSNHADPFHTAFYDSIDAVPALGITTGISAKERAITANHVVAENACPADFIKPGHLFPVIAKEGGVLVRKGHTEAAVDLCYLTALPPAAIICEIMDESGDMLRRVGLIDFAKKHHLKMISIAQLVAYRNEKDNLIEFISKATLPTEFGVFTSTVFKNKFTKEEHVVLSTNINAENTPVVRFHSECLTGDVFGSLRCDCKAQLTHALKEIASNGHGHLVYIKGHEGRGIGIANKIAAYGLQDQGQDTYQANLSLGLPKENRQYQDAIWILKALQVDQFKFITNNPEKTQALVDAGFKFEQVVVPPFVTEENRKYLTDKASIANHKLIL